MAVAGPPRVSVNQVSRPFFVGGIPKTVDEADGYSLHPLAKQSLVGLPELLRIDFAVNSAVRQRAFLHLESPLSGDEGFGFPVPEIENIPSIRSL